MCDQLPYSRPSECLPEPRLPPRTCSEDREELARLATGRTLIGLYTYFSWISGAIQPFVPALAIDHIVLVVHLRHRSQ